MRGVTRVVTQALFERGGLKAAFGYVRNLVIATVLVTAGFETVKRFDMIDLPGLANPLFAGYVVAGIGCLLIVLNLLDVSVSPCEATSVTNPKTCQVTPWHPA